MLQHDLSTRLKDAMRARDTLKVSVIRGILAACTNELVAKGRKPQDELSNEEALTVIRRLAKQCTDSIEQFKRGNREDLAEKEAAELAILGTYLPAQLDDEAVLHVIEEKKIALGITSTPDKGKLMGAVMQALKGQADGKKVKEMVDRALGA